MNDSNDKPLQTRKQHHYEKSRWTKDAKAYTELATIFNVMCWIIGIVGTITAIIMLFIGLNNLDDGGWATILGALVMAFQSFLVIIFGMMMNGLRRVLCAIFEMSVSDTRACMELLESEQRG
jgi:energy-converting hydrogenase Eha subunit B